MHVRFLLKVRPPHFNDENGDVTSAMPYETKFDDWNDKTIVNSGRPQTKIIWQPKSNILLREVEGVQNELSRINGNLKLLKHKNKSGNTKYGEL